MIRTIITILLFSQGTLAFEIGIKKENIAIDNVSVEKRSKIFLYGDYFSASNSKLKSSISGPSVGLGIRYGLNQRFAVGGTIKQNFSSLGASASFTSIELNAHYSLSVLMLKTDKKVRLNHESIMEGLASRKSGLVYGLHASQFIFNGSSAALPLTGLGASLNYELNTRKATYSIGGRMDYLINGDTSVTPLTISIGIGFWL